MSDSKRVFIDTNVFLREFVPDNKKLAQECRQFLKRIADGALTAETSTFVCTEIQWVLKRQYKKNKELRIEALESILQLNNLSFVDTNDLPRALDLYAAHDVKFVDCLIGAYALTEEVPIVSYDTDFDALGCDRVEPAEVPNQ